MAKTPRKFESLCYAIAEGSAADVGQLLAAGADPNEIEEAGDLTPLMVAAARGDLEIVKALVKASADVNALAEDLSGDLDDFEFLDEAFQQGEVHGLTALIYAVLYGHAEVKKYLARFTITGVQSLVCRKQRRRLCPPGRCGGTGPRSIGGLVCSWGCHL
jgi:ankyrin repeat protein